MCLISPRMCLISPRMCLISPRMCLISPRMCLYTCLQVNLLCSQTAFLHSTFTHFVYNFSNKLPSDICLKPPSTMVATWFSSVLVKKLSNDGVSGSALHRTQLFVVRIAIKFTFVPKSFW